MKISLESCVLCPRACFADRTKRGGFCKAGVNARVSHTMLHHFEEPVISGNPESVRGSGAVFFSGCTLRCVYCQNKKISEDASVGREMSVPELAGVFSELVSRGAYNINLVSPTPYVLPIISALDEADVSVPIVYNTGGYETRDTVRALEGHIGVYLTDFKYASPERAKKYSAAENYPEYALSSLEEMIKQVGRAEYYTEDGVRLMKRGVIVRHLVLPGGRHDTENVLRLLAANFSPEDFVLSLMRQYTPGFAPAQFHELSRRVTSFEYDFCAELASELGFCGFIQEKESARAAFLPDFDTFDG